MRTGKLAYASIVVFAAAALAACSSSTAGSPAPVTPQSSSANSLPHHGAPAVSSPLTTKAAENDPCSMATNDEVGQVGGAVSGNRVSTLSAGKFCTFTFANESGTVAVGVDTIDKDGISHLYALKAQNSGITTFEPQSAILGYPSVKFANGGERPYDCQLAVGVSDKTMLMVFSRLSTGNPHYSDPCTLSSQVAQFAVQHLKGS